MPVCSENYESEIAEGRNCRSVKCKFCGSVILSPSTATFASFEFQLPLIRQNKSNETEPETETVSFFWSVSDMYTFQNVGFSHTVGNNKYLACADCEAGPIGYHDLTNKTSFVALSRVQHS
ncbi:guanine nucleotide exchange factor MSS4 [Tribolium castaneum]|uniref:Guanine nucleotide exchange factor MSS4 homolog-like Protein n=1 Tax=Tribolium castaneum TaxID=7070 RepID=D6WSW3_TRICA|nr:PREDICTED: guanine nucleotide exchange factor MSS4 [Tribolium castaneum]EFA07674.2 Guanine nucleotide exchange factor MSS4 homolog-like Protein [Tribolium castaneum]|eukprot:XP_008195383.1 PREDICTED: guanine nucleotide exchange factor MSS4 [Tribolium castaneum]